MCQVLRSRGPGQVLGARLGTLAQESWTWGRRAEQAQWGPAELLAAALKGVLGLLGLQSREPHSYCPQVVGVTGQRGSQEGCLASGNSYCSCCGNRAKSHPVTSCEEIQKGWGGLCTLMGF